MPATELAYEMLALALETNRGTLTTPPTHKLNATGMVTPMEEEYFPPDQVGVLAEYQRSEIIRKWAEWSADSGADTTKLPLLLNMLLAPLTAGVVSGGELATTPVSAGGSGYTRAPTVTITAPAAGGRQATATATITGDAVTTVTITDPGSHYTSAPTIGFTGGGGSGAAVASPTITAQGVLSYLWEFVRVMTSDTIKSATVYWGDPNVQALQSKYAMLTEMVLSGDASGTDGVTMSLKGIGQFPVQILTGAMPALPAIAVGPILQPGAMQFWMEPNTTAPFGTTAITGRVVSAEVTIPSGVVPKYVAVGPTGGVTYDHVGRQKTHPEMKVVMEMADVTQYDLYAAGTSVKARVRFNNTTAIETVSASARYPYIECDIQGKLGAVSWGELEGTNRTIEFTIRGVYSSQLASDFRARVQNSSAAL